MLYEVITIEIADRAARLERKQRYAEAAILWHRAADAARLDVNKNWFMARNIYCLSHWVCNK